MIYFTYILLGTRKIQQNCTASIKLTMERDGSFIANVCHTHHNHTNQLEHTRLTKGRREKIAINLQQGISKDKIPDDARDAAMQQNDHTFKRHYLIGYKDLGNIKASFGIHDVQRHKNDQCSVKARVEWQ